MLAARPRAGGARKRRDRHGQPDDRLPRDVAGRVRGRAGRARSADGRARRRRCSFRCLRGLAAGDRVVASGSFLVDAETRLNPAAGSIYFGGSGRRRAARARRPCDRPRPKTPTPRSQPPWHGSRRPIASWPRQQRFCPVLSENRLGVMGTPVKLMIDGQPVFVCCGGCGRRRWPIRARRSRKSSSLSTSSPPRPATRADTPRPTSQTSAEEPPPEEPAPEKPAAADSSVKEEAKSPPRWPSCRLRIARWPLRSATAPCSTHSRLGAMGPPVKLSIGGQTVFVCCDGCREKALADPQETLQKLARRQEARAPRHDRKNHRILDPQPVRGADPGRRR